MRMMTRMLGILTRGMKVRTITTMGMRMMMMMPTRMTMMSRF